MKVVALADGFYDGSFRKKGSEFIVSPKYKLGKWMKPVEAEKKAEKNDESPSTGSASGLDSLSYADLYEQAKALGMTFEQKPSKVALVEAVEAKLKESGEG